MAATGPAGVSLSVKGYAASPVVISLANSHYVPPKAACRLSLVVEGSARSLAW